MESLPACTVHTLTCLSVDLMVYHYPRRKPNIKRTLIQRFVFEKNCNCYFNCSIRKVSAVHTKYTILVRYSAPVCDAGPEFKHWINVFLLANPETKGWSRSGHKSPLFTLLAMNVESPHMSTIEPHWAQL